MIVNYIDIADNFYFNQDVAACIGHFDGVHLGHQALINSAIFKAKELNIKSAMITFDPDPKSILTSKVTKILTTIEEKIKRSAYFGIDIMYIIRFDQNLAMLSANDFITKVLFRLSIRSLTCGFDFRFGNKGFGTIATLEAALKNHIELEIIAQISHDDQKISSTWINTLLHQGKLKLVNTLLGYPFALSGIVIKGHQVGRRLNFPTANIAYQDNQSLPKIGVYIGLIIFENKIYQAMINVGNNPTFYQKHHTTIEAHILNFDQDIYEKQIRIIFIERLRDEIKYQNADSLIQQLNDDKIAVQKYFKINQINMSLLL
ncbi:MAG: bifunctional riboflavin kinase/FAD synthetase [Erysipelotrichaceae bacterium]|nr:bifunctional riboflavin kinase/FAD synthetase [Erysipelotrichaceae bacterium]